jgi:hypothetical protein
MPKNRPNMKHNRNSALIKVEHSYKMVDADVVEFKADI